MNIKKVITRALLLLRSDYQPLQIIITSSAVFCSESNDYKMFEWFLIVSYYIEKIFI